MNYEEQVDEPLDYDQIARELISRWEKSMVNWYRVNNEDSDEYDESKQAIYQDECEFLESLIDRIEDNCKRELTLWKMYKEHPSPIVLIESRVVKDAE